MFRKYDLNWLVSIKKEKIILEVAVQGQSKHISLGSKPKHGPWMAYFEFDINTNI